MSYKYHTKNVGEEVTYRGECKHTKCKYRTAWSKTRDAVARLMLSHEELFHGES